MLCAFLLNSTRINAIYLYIQNYRYIYGMNKWIYLLQHIVWFPNRNAICLLMAFYSTLKLFAQAMTKKQNKNGTNTTMHTKQN